MRTLETMLIIKIEHDITKCYLISCINVKELTAGYYKGRGKKWTPFISDKKKDTFNYHILDETDTKKNAQILKTCYIDYVDPLCFNCLPNTAGLKYQTNIDFDIPVVKSIGCMYCGSLYANERDHVQCSLFHQGSKKHFEVDTVLSCKECNVLLGSKLYTTVPERAKYLFDIYQNRYKHELTLPRWDPKDIAQLGPNLHSSLSTSVYTKADTENRLRHLRSKFT